MKILRLIAVAIAGLVVVAIAAALVMPRHVTVIRTVQIAAEPAAVFPLVADLRRFNEWSPWFERDPATTYLFTGPTEGVGQTLRWESSDPELGSGSLTVEQVEPEREVTIAAFGRRGAAETRFTLDPAGGGTEVAWAFTTDLGFNPVSRYFGMTYVERIGADYERGLALLKAVAEAPPEPDED